MVDRINGYKGTDPLANLNRTDKSGKAKPAAGQKASDRVDFSSALQNASKTREAAGTQEATRMEKVQSLKAQIENGTYQPDLNKVASSLLPFLMKDS